MWDFLSEERTSSLFAIAAGPLERSWLRHYAISRKVAGSRPDEVITFFFSIYLILPASVGLGVDSVSNRIELGV
jgi:hypothetical protein